MKRLSPCLLGILVAAGPACVTKEGPTTPDPPAAADAPPTRWTGTATYTDETEYETGVTKQRFDLEVTWVKAENPSPAPPPGTTRYVPSGRVRSSLQSYADRGGTCTADRQAEFAIAVPDLPLAEDEQVLDLGPDGRYHGRLYGSWSLDYVEFCRDRAFSRNRLVRVRLDIGGTRDGNRMHGAMPPQVVENALLKSTTAGAWDFGAN